MADIVVHDARSAWLPRGDMAMQLIWATDGRSVRDVFVAGQRIVGDGRCLRVDLPSLAAPAVERREAALARAGVYLPPPRWPHIAAH